MMNQSAFVCRAASFSPIDSSIFFLNKSVASLKCFVYKRVILECPFLMFTVNTSKKVFFGECPFGFKIVIIGTPFLQTLTEFQKNGLNIARFLKELVIIHGSKNCL